MKEDIRIAIVEDDKVYATRIAHELKEDGYSDIKQYEDGISFLLKLITLDPKPDVIILDYLLGDQENGLEVLREIQMKSTQSKVVFLSGQSDIRVAIKAVKKGAFDYFTKDETSFWRVVNAVNKIHEQKELVLVQKKKTVFVTAVGVVTFLIVGIGFYFFNLKFKLI